MEPAIVSAKPRRSSRREIRRVRTIVSRSRLTALLADGDRLCRLVQKAMLRYFGVETQDVDNGVAAVYLFACGLTFDLIVIDIALPVLDGLEVIRLIRSMGISSKIVGMSLAWTERDRQALLDAGANTAIEKPLSNETLMPILLELHGQV